MASSMGLKNRTEGLRLVGFLFYGLNFLLSGFVLNLVHFLLWIILKPINNRLYRHISYYLSYQVCGMLQFLAEWWSSSTCMIYTDDKTWDLMGTEHAINITNHSYELDPVFVLFFCDQIKVLGGMKVFAKKSLQLMPILGLTGIFSEHIFLARSWEADKKTISEKLTNLRDYPHPVLERTERMEQLHMFPEGTRFTNEKHQVSLDFARKSGLQPMKHLLVPRTKGFTLSLEKLRGKFPAVYCTTIVFDTKEGADPLLMSLGLGRSVHARMLVERVPIEDIPEETEEAARWLHEKFLHKDQMIDVFQTTGTFPSTMPGNHHFEGPIRAHYQPRRLWTLIWIVASSSVTLPLLVKTFFTLLFSGILPATICLVLLASIIFVLLKMMDAANPSKGSAYGRSTHSKTA